MPTIESTPQRLVLQSGSTKLTLDKEAGKVSMQRKVLFWNRAPIEKALAEIADATVDAAVDRSLPIRLSPTATSGSVRPCSWTFTSVAIFGSHNRSQSSSDFFPTTRPAPPTWRRLAGATGLFAPIVRRRESRSASQIVLASCAAASAAVTPD